ncbi:MAG: hypothetical protein GX845_01560 [Erysipelothrix sp.]|nr:hypothetical protein [Erysipelothrix sp.]
MAFKKQHRETPEIKDIHYRLSVLSDQDVVADKRTVFNYYGLDIIVSS